MIENNHNRRRRDYFSLLAVSLRWTKSADYHRDTDGQAFVILDGDMAPRHHHGRSVSRICLQAILDQHWREMKTGAVRLEGWARC